MNTYNAGHVAAMHGFLVLFLVLVGLLVLAGIGYGLAWLHHRWAHRDHRAAGRRPVFEPEELS